MTLLAGMHYDVTTVGFYDAMTTKQVDHILEQTHLTTVFCSLTYAEKIIAMRKAGQATYIKNLVLLQVE